jgi:Fe2+ transport system protein FeoA
MKSLNEVNSLKPFKIVEIRGDPELASRLIELGFTVDESVRIIARSVFGDPFMVEIRGSVFALRSDEAGCIWIKE